MSATVIHPTFDPETNTWFVTEPSACEAPTIRELKTKLRREHPNKRFAVADYYPLGTPSPKPVWADDKLPPFRPHAPLRRSGVTEAAVAEAQANKRKVAGFLAKRKEHMKAVQLAKLHDASFKQKVSRNLVDSDFD